MCGHRLLLRRERDTDRTLLRSGREGTRTPEKHDAQVSGPERSSVEVLTAYTHPTQAADLELCRTAARTNAGHDTCSGLLSTFAARTAANEDTTMIRYFRS